jgi:hypothetical protein
MLREAETGHFTDTGDGAQVSMKKTDRFDEPQCEAARTLQQLIFW